MVPFFLGLLVLSLLGSMVALCVIFNDVIMAVLEGILGLALLATILYISYLIVYNIGLAIQRLF
jgi:hypothetical protein